MEFFEPGTVLYRYSIRNGTLKVYKGTVVEAKYGSCYPHLRMVAYSTKTNKDRAPLPSQVNRVLTGGPSIWLTERDDHKAAMMFHEYELGKLSELEVAVEKKKALIKGLESVGMEG